MKPNELQSALYELLAAPLRIEEIRRALPQAGRNELKDALDGLIADGRVMKNKKNRYAQSAHYGCVAGTYLATERAFGFVTPDAEPGADKPDDLFIPPNASGGAWHGDRVLVRVSERKNSRGRTEGAVLRVLRRADKELTGALVQRGKHFFVEPSSKKYPEIYIDPHDLGGAEAGDRVAVTVSHYGGEQLLPRGTVQADLGTEGTMAASIASVLRENGVFDVFPAEVLAQAEGIPQQVEPAALDGRLDLRDKLIFTIDGDDAKDFDDAVSLEPLENGHLLLGVHIADVSHYVTPGSPLDGEAFRRGTSVYYPRHVVPMLPFALSNGICSLRPEVDRLTFSALMEIDKDGRRHGATFAKSVIRSRARMTYNNVNQILAGDETLRAQYAFLAETADRMNALAQTLHKRRIERGALELDIPEAQVVVDENGEPAELQYRARGEAERLIEEFMLQANEAVAAFMAGRGDPTVYRVHENPDPDKLAAFAAFARPFGYRIDPSKPEDTFQLQTVLRGAQNDPAQRALPTLLLRSLARARYADECLGHYGLKAKFYLHFTSPIRRYPDLIAHRMLQKALTGEVFTGADESMCEEAAQQSTAREFAADACERDITALFVARYMQRFIGEEFDAEVSGVQPFGLFVSLANGCEGLIRIELLAGDFYQYDDQRMTLTGRHTGKRFTIGTPIRVKLLAASEITGQVDFAPADGALPVSPVPPTPPAQEDAPVPSGNRVARRRQGKGRGGSRKGRKPATRKRR
ncbi:MAG: ribonuclease R [Agathobaculum sp.]|uniref:ribonuclease R n=1 Tax=Agathobaculum sp. TaxID=2048138 RepID=UPI002A80AAC6|nr:ribonuclease R [Agathobaculum sp.]MDY3712815.1 ribonuclease R [Agathobaculum sp.]